MKIKQNRSNNRQFVSNINRKSSSDNHHHTSFCNDSNGNGSGSNNSISFSICLFNSSCVFFSLGALAFSDFSRCAMQSKLTHSLLSEFCVNDDRQLFEREKTAINDRRIAPSVWFDAERKTRRKALQLELSKNSTDSSETICFDKQLCCCCLVK